MILGIIDCETDGFDRQTSEVVEIAIKLYSAELKTNIGAFSFLVKGKGTNAAEHVNKIPSEALCLPAVADSQLSAEIFFAMIEKCDVLIAHNASFDRDFINKFLASHGLSTDKPWICSLNHLTFPKEGKTKSLAYLALDHGIFISGAHRALVDTHMLEELIKQIDNIEEQLKPRFKYLAMVTKERKDEAKNVGFRWDADERVWWKYLTNEEAQRLSSTVDFEILLEA